MTDKPMDQWGSKDIAAYCREDQSWRGEDKIRGIRPQEGVPHNRGGAIKDKINKARRAAQAIRMAQK